MESQPQNPEFRINPENVNPCIHNRNSHRKDKYKWNSIWNSKLCNNVCKHVYPFIYDNYIYHMTLRLFSG